MALPFYILVDNNAFTDFYTSDITADGAVESCRQEEQSRNVQQVASSTHHPRGMTIFWACLLYLFGTILIGGLLISIFTNIIERRVERYRSGNIYYCRSGHYVVLGYDDMVPSLVTHLLQQSPKSYVFILSALPATDVRERLSHTLSNKQLDHILVNHAYRTQPQAYRDLHLESARAVFIVGYRFGQTHDAVNIACIDHICDYLQGLRDGKHAGGPQRITCIFEDSDTYAAFKTTDLFRRVRDLHIDFMPYNYFTEWARRVLVERSYLAGEATTQYPAVYTQQCLTPTDGRYVHLVFVGITNFATTLAMEAAHMLHFPNFNHNQQLRTRITFIDLSADHEKDVFVTRNRHFFEVQPCRYRDLMQSSATSAAEPPQGFLDVDFEFIKGDIFSQPVQQLLSHWADDTTGRSLSIFLAMTDQHANFAMGMNMPDSVYRNGIPVFIRQDHTHNFVTNLRGAYDDAQAVHYAVNDEGGLQTDRQYRRYAALYPFGMNESCYVDNEQYLWWAVLINYLYDKEFNVNDTLTPAQQADAKAGWNKKPVAEQWSNLYAAYTLRVKLDILRAMRGYDIDDDSHDTEPISDQEIDELARVEHNRWNVEKLLMGYRRPSDSENPYRHPLLNDAVPDGEAMKKQNKENFFIHHDIRPYDELSQSSKDKDIKFLRYLPWILNNGHLGDKQE